MRIFVNDKPLDILSNKKLESVSKFSLVFKEGEAFENIKVWKGDILFEEPDETLIIKVLYLLRTRKIKGLNSISFVTKDKKRLKAFIKSRFMIIKAAGGIVQRDGDSLLIYRLGKWDFPKGKFEKGESAKECAVREVEEECNIRVKAHEKICNTWHTYTKDRKSILKKTYWYDMSCLSDEGMQPQKEEGIEDVRWLSAAETKKALKNSYPSMRYLAEKSLQLK